MEELARHGYDVGPGTLCPTMRKLEKGGFLTCKARTVDPKQRRYDRITPAGISLLDKMKMKIEALYDEVVKER